MNPHDTTCPSCGHLGLEIDLRLEPNDDPPRWRPVLACPAGACTYAQWGEIEGHDAVFLVPEAADLEHR